MKIREIDTAIFTLDEQNLLTVKYKDEVEIDLKEMIVVVETTLSMVEGSEFYLLIDAQNILSSITNDAREYLTNHIEYERLVIAMAIIVNNLPVRIIANFFKNFHKQPNPVSIFSDLPQGKAWLLAQTKK